MSMQLVAAELETEAMAQPLQLSDNDFLNCHLLSPKRLRKIKSVSINPIILPLATWHP